MKQIEVVAAIIIDRERILATQRGYGEFKGGWEFPGGKVEKGESNEEALIREIKEELETEIVVIEHFDYVQYNYPTFHLSMHCYLCKVKSGELILKEHQAARWLTKDTIFDVEWLPADYDTVKKLQEYLSEKSHV